MGQPRSRVHSAHRWFDDPNAIHLAYVGTLLPAGFDTLRALFEALAAERLRDAAVARMRLHFFGTSNLRAENAPERVLPIAAEFGITDASPNTHRASITSTRSAC